MVSPTIKIIVESSAGVESGEFENARDISLTRFLSSIGELVFTIPKDDPKFALLTGKKSRLKVIRNGTTIWRGVYDYLRETPDNYVIFASTLESILMDYLVDPDAPTTSTIRKFTTKKIGTEIVQVLFNESKAKTGSNFSDFTLGTIENPYTPGTTTELTTNAEFNYENLFDAISLMAQGGGADFEVTTAKAFNFLRRKGTDHPNVVLHLKDEEPSNISTYQRDTDFRRIGNDIYAFGVGVGVNFLKSVKTDATSQSTYGLIQKNLGMPKVLVAQTSLDKLVADQINLIKDPPQTTTPLLVADGIGFLDGWDLGDNVKVDIDHGGTIINEYRRVLGFQVAYGNTGAENVYVYLGVKRA